MNANKINKIKKAIILITIFSYKISFGNPKDDKKIEIDILNKSIQALTLSQQQQNSLQIDFVFSQVSNLLASLKNVQNLKLENQDKVSILINKSINAIVSLLKNPNNEVNKIALIKLNNLINQLKQLSLTIENTSTLQLDKKTQSDWLSTIDASLLTIKERCLKFINSTNISDQLKLNVVELLFDNSENFKNSKLIINEQDLLISLDKQNEELHKLNGLSEYEKILIMYFLNKNEEISYTKENIHLIQEIKNDYTHKMNNLNLIEFNNLISSILKFSTLNNTAIEKLNLELITMISNQNILSKFLQSENGSKKIISLIFGLLLQNNLTYTTGGLDLLKSVLVSTLNFDTHAKKRILEQLVNSTHLDAHLSIIKSIASHNKNNQYTLNQLSNIFKKNVLPMLRLIDSGNIKAERSLLNFIGEIESSIKSNTKGIKSFEINNRPEGRMIEECRNILILIE